MPFCNESEFEDAVVAALSRYGWEERTLDYCSADDLLRNWAAILFKNNRGKDRLNDYPLTEGEMRQILEQIKALKTPAKLNAFINGQTVTVIRDCEEDAAHLGKAVALKIYDRTEIAAGQSCYQIARQPRLAARSKMLSDRRGDLMLLINGMPVIHIELKKSGVPASQACNQIEKYMSEGVYKGIFSLVQIFVAMNPEETLYFANPGPDGAFERSFFFHWADFNNEPINEWQKVIKELLSIPMAHQLIGFYTVADGGDGILKVMRSYQYYAANAISDKVAENKNRWGKESQRGGYVWHTTGSGKTMTSFKAAQLIATSRAADKVVFLVDRIELGTQSLGEYKNFAGDIAEVQGTENTVELASRLKSSRPDDTLIVTSIQKMSNIRDDAESPLKAADIEEMQAKRVVFIIDECHRSTFGEMLITIKQTFPLALFFGFTGTPIQEEHQIRMSTTATIFGDELHRYSIADGIRDGNVLGFDPYMALTYRDNDLREAVALDKAKAATVSEALADPKKAEVYYKYCSLPMAGDTDKSGNYVKGIEDYIPNSQYERDEHRQKVVEDIAANWERLSRSGKFHAIFATSSIAEAIEYYRLIKAKAPFLKASALFDPTIDNTGGARYKEDGLAEIIEGYNSLFRQSFSIPTFAAMKKDMSLRLAHKGIYKSVEKEKQIDIVIVVNQMLTGFDSKWVNTLYLDKVIEYQDIIQAFSRTNRLFGPEKPFGTIKYYRRPHTMQKYIEAAVKLYSGDRPFGMFAEKLDANIENLNGIFQEIKRVFEASGDKDFAALPADVPSRRKFASLFRKLNVCLEAARVQGFSWEKAEYVFPASEGGGETRVVSPCFSETAFKILALRYKELFKGNKGDEGVDGGMSLPYEIDAHLATIDTADIDTDYMNSRFEKYIKALMQEGEDAEAIRKAEEDLHRTFAALTQEDQKLAVLFLHDIQNGDAIPASGKTFRDYIAEYAARQHSDQIHRLAVALGADEEMLREMTEMRPTEREINAYGRFDKLKDTVDFDTAKRHFEALEGAALPPRKVHQKTTALLRGFILSGGFDI